MDRKQELIDRIVEAEHRMFTGVPGPGGRAACQDDYKTFEINRSSQSMSWSEAILESYLEDLNEAEKNGRNLLTEKYARMMQSTSPSEYAAIEHLIPALDPEAPSLINRIVKVILQWEEALKEKYPYILKKGRPLHSSEDSPLVTSVETYLRGELATYSLKTLKLYYEHIIREKSENVNGSEVVLYHMMKRYGFTSLENANERLKAGT